MKQTDSTTPKGGVWAKLNQAPNPATDGGGKNIPKELTDEIRAFREKQKEFDATNDHQTYAIVVFSTKEDKELFLKECQMPFTDTIVDGYKLAKKLGKSPQVPKFKLKPPF